MCNVEDRAFGVSSSLSVRKHFTVDDLLFKVERMKTEQEAHK